LQNSEQLEVSVDQLVADIQEILYSTTEGFQIPTEDPPLETPLDSGKENDVKMVDEETF
ncbi:hypothetical protein OGATHE_001754, partial [Ogataea polymorpha]